MKIDYQHVVYDEKCLSVVRYENVLYVIHLQQHILNDLYRQFIKIFFTLPNYYFQYIY